MTKIEKIEKSKTTGGITRLIGKVKRSEGSGMETDQAEQLDVL